MKKATSRELLSSRLPCGRVLAAIGLVFAAVLVAAPAAPVAAASTAQNVNTRYDVESVSVSGISEERLSDALLADMQALVGRKYDPEASDAIAARIRIELRHYDVTVKVQRGERREHVHLTFDARRPIFARAFDSRLPTLVYHSYEGFSGAIVPGFETHHNHFSAGLVSNSDELLERYVGVLLRYEHRRVGTDRVRIAVEYERYHPSFKPEITNALKLAPLVAGTYRTRRAFSPSVSVFPLRQLRLTFGTSLQNLRFMEPSPGERRAYAWVAGVQLRERVGSGRRHGHSIGVDYSLRAARKSLESDFEYTRHLVTAEYTLTDGRHGFNARADLGYTDGNPPLFERFSIGNATTLRGWNKFDVAPLGGVRLAYGSLEYRYRPFFVFYDFGSVWDPEGDPTMRNSVGFGVGTRDGFFLTVGFPIRLDRVVPSVMIGFSG